jgi:serine/threonine protein kinase
VARREEDPAARDKPSPYGTDSPRQRFLMVACAMRRCTQCEAESAEDVRFCPFCGAAFTSGSTPPEDPIIGRIINGKYRVESFLSQGGMGRLYKATHLTLERAIVLKMLHKVFSNDPAIGERFHREAKAASRLNHPNSIAVLDFGSTEDGTLFIAMEWLGGRDLAHVIAEDYPLEEPRTIRIGAQILSALAEAHAHGIVHRDLKPENVMVEPRREELDHVKVLDFGIAKISDPGPNAPKLTQAGLVCGTPEYMSPEQAAGDDLDHRSDIYSMGVILYQMVTGELPFDSSTAAGYLTKHLNEPVVPPSQKRAEIVVSPALEALIMRALAKDPAARPESAERMRAELIACGVPAGQVETPPSGQRVAALPEARPVRSRVPLVLAAVILAAAVGGGGAYVVMTRRSPPARPNEGESAHPSPGTTSTPTPEFGSTKSETPGPEPTPAPTPNPEPAPAPQPPKPPVKVRPHDRVRAVDLYQRAEERRAEQDADGAIRLYLQAEAADPTLYSVQKKLAICYQLEGENQKAIERYRKYLASKPEDAEAVRAILRTLR